MSHRTLIVAVGAIGLLLAIGAVTLVGPDDDKPSQAVVPVIQVDPDRAAALAAYTRMTPGQRVGQLFMIGVGADHASRFERREIADLSLGNVFLRGRSDSGVAATSRLTRTLGTAATRRGVRPFVAADQEGGEVQTLQGPGFARIPTALDQGRLGRSGLRVDARSWGRQLARAGVNLDLAPVADVVPAYVGEANQPIGRYDRELGHRSRPVSRHVEAFVRGMADAGVTSTLKHFPGLGRASGNTDAAGDVTAPTRRTDPSLRPFRAGVHAGADVVMVSSALYPHLDAARLACYSPIVMRTVLRGDLEFRGVVVSDSFDTPALAAQPPATRALRFLARGGTVVLDTEPHDLRPMVRAVRARVAREPAFARVVRAAVLHLLTVKARHGLVPR